MQIGKAAAIDADFLSAFVVNILVICVPSIAHKSQSKICNRQPVIKLASVKICNPQSGNLQFVRTLN